MRAKNSHGVIFSGIILVMIFSLLGCQRIPTTPSLEAGTYSVDPVFREFYASLGDRDLLGPAITALFHHRGKQCQYTQNVLMCFDPLVQGIDRFSLYPLGKTLGVNEEPVAAAAGSLVVNGYVIYEEFETLYHRMYGPLYVGSPLTQPRFNPNKNRIEQFFENVGFYRNIDDPHGEVYLLSYGVFTCSSDCRFSAPASALVVQPAGAVEQPYLTRIVRLGGLTVFGMPLTEPYLAEDGNLEQVYENVVLYAPLGNPNDVRLRSASQMLEMPSALPVSRQYGEADGVVFYPIKGEAGFHVPVAFDHFIASHGGLEISGPPLSDVIQIGENLFRQCFQNYCLQYDNNPGVTQRVRMTALGSDYMRKFQVQASSDNAFAIDAETVTILANVTNPRLPSDQPQQFELLVVRSQDQQPVSNIEASLTLTLPDGTQALYNLPATDAMGRTSLVIAPLQAAPANGSVIAYKMCLNIPARQPVCASESYLIWNYR